MASTPPFFASLELADGVVAGGVPIEAPGVVVIVLAHAYEHVFVAERDAEVVGIHRAEHRLHCRHWSDLRGSRFYPHEARMS